jgi:hypothetical protein
LFQVEGNCRSLGYARDDKGKGQRFHREWLLDRGVFQISGFLRHDAIPKERDTLPFVIPRACDFIGFEKKLMLKTKGLGASKVAKNQ